MLELSLYVSVFIVLSGVMAMVDAAVLSVSRAEVEEMVLQRKWGATLLRAIRLRLPRAVVVIVVVTNTINVLGPILAGSKAVELYGANVIGVVTAVLAMGTILFSEIIPKSLGAHYAPLVSRAAAPAIWGLSVALYPLVVPLEWVSNLLKSGERPIGTEAQIRSLVTIGHRAGYIESDEGQMIHRAFILNDKSAADIMTPCKDVVGIDASSTIHETAQRVLPTAFSRYPVFGPSVNDVRGIALSRDILKAHSEGRSAAAVSEIALEPLIVRADVRSDELLALFRDRHLHLAVVQEKGKTVGVVTLEDVLEELVGEIEDEKDVPSL